MMTNDLVQFCIPNYLFTNDIIYQIDETNVNYRLSLSFKRDVRQFGMVDSNNVTVQYTITC